ncbi:hypothetical protein [Streptomyces sp. NK08204]|uniref:hypothetical protein n=1 Tax=Streptomyces sp. NK08204 TaxID=2873260 RepID=UPI001CED1940|nr:hypothetical protein [Streptomyces sp. NK08204]
MSAPLVVNTTDGTCWTRREGERDGQALYAPEKCGGCPEFVMATLAELAEHGIVGSASVLPMPVGPEPLSDERMAEIRSLDLLSMMSDRVAPVVSRALADLITEVERLRAQRDRRRARLVALQNDALNIRGALSPNGEARKVPMPLGEMLLPAVEWLISRVAELEAERHSTNEALDDAVQELRARRDDAVPYTVTAEAHAQMREGLSSYFAGKRAALEDPHDGPLAHQYLLGRDLPETGGTR